MKRYALCCMVLMLCLLLQPMGSCSAEVAEVFLGGCGQSDEAYLALCSAYPEVTIHAESNWYLSTTELVNAFLCNEFPFDTFMMNSSSFDYSTLIAKGYCGTLTSDAYLCNEIERMLPAVQQLVQNSGELYGVPVYCNLQYYMYNPEAWEAANLTEADVPTSFEEYLDFLEMWVARIRDNPEHDISICNSFDGEQYGEHSYVQYLVEMLLDQYVMQCNYAGEPLSFSSPVFRTLLLRCQETGRALYAYEPRGKGAYALFDVNNGMHGLANLVPLRLTTDQPVLIKATLHSAFLNAASTETVIATQYLKNCLTYLDATIQAYLYTDAQPVESPQYATILSALQQTIDNLEAKLADETLDTQTRINLQERLCEKQVQWQQMSESAARYIVSPDDLANYYQYRDTLYFQPPSVFDPSTEEGIRVKQLCNRFCTGDLSANQFIAELDDLAWMLEMEQQ